uniref:Uncharacterized protein n=1 Tax=Rhizophora mucronata TaxID=61149 RepID=A0A2P2PRU0_RHIMU
MMSVTFASQYSTFKNFNSTAQLRECICTGRFSFGDPSEFFFAVKYWRTVLMMFLILYAQ